MLFLHLWDHSTLVSFTRRFCRNQLAARLQALIQGSMTLSAAQSLCVTRFPARHGESQLTERPVHVPVPASTSTSLDVRSVLGEVEFSIHMNPVTPDCFLAISLDSLRWCCSTDDEQ